MRPNLAVWQSSEDREWLSTLVDAMEDAARPEIRNRPCPPTVLAGLRAQLGRPVPQNPRHAPAFGGRADTDSSLADSSLGDSSLGDSSLADSRIGAR